MDSGKTRLKRTLMAGAVAVAGTLMLAPATAFARNNSSMNGPSATSSTNMSGDVSAQGNSDADDMSRSSTNVTGNTMSQSNPDTDETMRSSDRHNKTRADADRSRKGTDSDERNAGNSNSSDVDRRADTEDRTSGSRSSRFNANANGRFASDRDRGLDRAEDRRSDRGFIRRVSFHHHHHHHHHHMVFHDRDDMRTMNDRDRDEMRSNGDRDRDNRNPPSGY